MTNLTEIRKKLKKAYREIQPDQPVDFKKFITEDNIFSGFTIAETHNEAGENFIMLELGGNFSPMSLKVLRSMLIDIPKWIKHLEKQPRNKNK